MVKMNVDTDTQYWFTQPILKHMIENQAVLTHSGDQMADKKKFDPRAYLKKGEENMAKRVAQACQDLKSTGKTIFGK